MKKTAAPSRRSLYVKAMVLCLSLTQILFLAPIQTGIANNAYAAAPSRPLYKSTWLWNASSLLQNNNGELQFLQQNGVNLVFLQIDPDLPYEKYSRFIKSASELGIEVHALGGAPDWVIRENQYKLYKLIDWVKTYNGTVSAESQFKGIHLDVEPFVMKKWFEDTDTMLGLWRDTISGFVEQMKMDTPGLTAGADLPVWLDIFDVPDGYGGRTTLSNWMIRTLDQTTLMAYRDNASDIVASIATELGEADKNGKPVIVAVETLQSPESFITFYDKGRSRMLKELGTVENTLNNHASFTGYAVHDYLGWSSLKQ